MEILATILAGLGLFVIGVKMIGANLRQMTGRRVRRLMRASTAARPSAAAAGVLVGALTQSSSAATFIVASMTAAGLVDAFRASPLVIWAPAGTSLIVLLATADMRLIVLFLIAVVGVLYFMELDRSPRWRHALGALFGTALLFYGLQLLKSGAAPLRAVPDVVEFIEFAGESGFLGFLVGCLLTVVLQSSSTTAVIAVALATVGLLPFDQAVMLVYGANLGSGISTWLLGASLEGTPRRLADLQLVVKVLGCLVLVPLAAVEEALHVPLVAGWATWAGGSVPHALALVFLAFQVTAALAATLLGAWLWRLLERMTPESEREALSRPRFLYDEAVEDPEGAVDLLLREQRGLIERLPLLLEAVRGEGRPEAVPPPAVLLPASLAVAGEVRRLAAEVLERAPAQHVVAGLVQVENRNRTVASLFETVAELARALAAAPAGGAIAPTLHALTEALHLLLSSMAEDLDSPDGRALLAVLAGDRSELMDRMRRNVLAGLRDADPATQAALFGTTGLFERAVWLIRQVVVLSGGVAGMNDAGGVPAGASGESP